MAWVGAAIGGIGQLAGANAAAKAGKLADKRLVEGRDYAVNKSGLGTYRDTGVQAAQTQQGLLGIGGDPVAAQNAYGQFLNSTGYRAQLQGVNDAVTSNAAARGMLKSGATLKGLAREGANLSNSYFTSYLNQVGDVAGRGMQAADSLARTVTGVGGQMADVAQNVGVAQQNAYGKVGSLIGQGVNYTIGQNAPPTPATHSIWG